MKPKIGLLSLGCPRNLVDSEGILGRLKYKGHSIVDLKDADIAIVNTCAFVEEAKRESVEAILDLIELKKEGKLKKILVYGCLAQRYKQELAKELPEVDAFVGRVSLNHEKSRFPVTPGHFAYLKICEGCVNACSYCVIPKIKGKFVSLDEASIIERVRVFNQQRISELNIIGQDITGFGIDSYGSTRLHEVLKKINKEAPDIGWIRLLYLNPARITDELLKVMKDCPKVCKYIDLPIQHISDRILKAMNRRTTRRDILVLIEKIRKTIPQVALRTSLIVGFPSETEKEFKELLEFVKVIKFERLGAFVYSREEGTPAYNFKGQVPQKAKEARFNAIMSAQNEVSRQINKNMLNKVIEVLIDESGKDFYLGRSRSDAPEVDGQVYVRSAKKLKSGDFVRVKVIDTLDYDLVGEVVQ